jgi:hypothetical protein
VKVPGPDSYQFCQSLADLENAWIYWYIERIGGNGKRSTEVKGKTRKTKAEEY